jgi:hypothetical protein
MIFRRGRLADGIYEISLTRAKARARPQSLGSKV